MQADKSAKQPSEFQRATENNLYHDRGANMHSASRYDAYVALCATVRDRLVDRWRKTVDVNVATKPKYVYYLSAEYLPGRQLTNNLLYTDTYDVAREAFRAHDLELDEFIAIDREPGLGNGGLGRLASCFLDSLATLDIPAIGYGIRYEFGIFKQRIENGWQVESPDDWLAYGNPWEFGQSDDRVKVGFGGATRTCTDEQGAERVAWDPAEQVMAEPYMVFVPGYGTNRVNVMRLWRARATHEFDFQLFDVGDYAHAVEEKVRSENISKVLYPNDHTLQGRRLRLKQQYFFVSASIREILERHIRRHGDDCSSLPEKAVISLNDSHPIIAIPELMRLLVDERRLAWDEAWRICTRTFAYTCHTNLPEALERWPVDLMAGLLPRHMEIIYEINHRLLEQVAARFPDDPARLRRMSIIDEENGRQVRMAHLGIAGSYSVFGVSDLLSKQLIEDLFSDFAELWPQKFTTTTNGVSTRRFVRLANPRLSELITSEIGDSWLREEERLGKLEPLAESADFRRRWREVKRANKSEVADYVKRELGLEIDPDSMFDLFVKRLHEYKRQLLKALHCVALHQRIKDDPGAFFAPRTCLFGAKAAPGYRTAKLIIKFIHTIADVINRDTAVNGRLRIAFLPDFNVTLGEKLYPAADLSQQISLAGTEGSGTGNMKFVLNGAVTVGTYDGANIDIRERVGEENFFLFGMDAAEVAARKAAGYDPRGIYENDLVLRRALHAMVDGAYGETDLFRPLFESLLQRDEYMLLADFESYADTMDRAAEAYLKTEAWTRISILNTARSGWFSSDRTMRDYCQNIWRVAAVPVG